MIVVGGARNCRGRASSLRKDITWHHNRIKDTRMKMPIDVYRVPFSCYPRCQYAHKHLKQLSDRYEYLTNDQLPKQPNPVLHDTSFRINNNNPVFHVCLQNIRTSDKGRKFGINDVLKRNEGSRFIETVKCENVRDVVHSKAYMNEEYVIVITNANVNEDDVPQGDNVQIIEVTEDRKDVDKALRYWKVSHNLYMSSKELISDQVCNLMEQNIFEAFKMKTKCEFLLRTLDSIQKVETWQGNNILSNVEEQNSQNEYSSTGRAKSAGNNSPRGAYVSPYDWRFSDVERMERLYDEMKGMFTRSRVPKDEQPQFDSQFDGILDKKLKEDLRQFSSSIKGCGFRFRSVLVFAEDNCDQDNLKSGIERVLKNHNIHKFSIVSSKVRELSSCNVGSEVTANFDDGTIKCGKVGGFGRASSDECNKTICLVSRHVVTDVNGDAASELKVLNDGNATDVSVMVDKSITDRRETVLDIAAASFKGDESQFDTRYKTSEKNAATGKLSEYSIEELKGLPVHICGSKTPIGYGTITVPKVEGVQDNSMNDFIIIEDTEHPLQEKVPFCKAGDSGAIVCADDQENPDNVQLISMVMGEDTHETGTYYSLKLGKGVTQVKEEIQANSIQLL